MCNITSFHNFGPSPRSEDEDIPKHVFVEVDNVGVDIDFIASMEIFVSNYSTAA